MRDELAGECYVQGRISAGGVVETTEDDWDVQFDGHTGIAVARAIARDREDPAGLRKFDVLNWQRKLSARAGVISPTNVASVSGSIVEATKVAADSFSRPMMIAGPPVRRSAGPPGRRVPRRPAECAKPLARTAEAVWSELDTDQRDAARRLLLRLVTSAEDGPPVATHLSGRAIVGRRVEGVLDRLVAARLVTADGDTVTVAHARLATAWPRLNGWFNDTAAERERIEHLRVSASGRPRGDLYRGHRLAHTLAWRADTSPVLEPLEPHSSTRRPPVGTWFGDGSARSSG